MTAVAVRARRVRRTALVHAVLGALVLAALLLALCLGDRPTSPLDVVQALLGGGSGGDRFVVTELRLPRALLALVVGACLGAAGAVFQSLLGNPLASPDIIGVTQGASGAAATALLLGGLSGAALSLAALGGALLAAVVILALSAGRRRADARFVIVGIAVAFLVNALVSYLLTRADVREAQTALAWLVGSLGTPDLPEVAVAAVPAAILGLVLVPLVPRLEALRLGEDAAAGLGVAVTRTRLALGLVAVGLAAIAVAAAGPVAFIAFVSGPVARRLVPGAAVPAAALVGATLVAVADVVAQHAVPGIRVPVGIVTSLVGGPALLVLLARRTRSEGAA